MEKKTIGIIGGMGPLATCDLFEKIIRHTRVSCDQEHLHVLIDNNPAVPDRTKALLHGGESPLPALCASARRLEADGAQVLLLPCNTSHHYYAELSAAVSVPLLHMIALTRDALLRKGVSCAGLLATDGTLQTGVYQDAFAGSGVTLLPPEAAEQAAVMDTIYRGVKADDPAYTPAALSEACRSLLARGAQVLILGCTELPIAFDRWQLPFPVVDPTLELALAAIRFAGGSVKE